MRFRATVFLAGAALLAGIAGCAAGGSPAAAPQTAAIALVDDAGRSVTMARPAAKVISLAPSNTELVYAVGAGDKVVAVDDYSDFPAEVKAKPKIGGFATTDFEKVVGLAPDLVLATNIHQKSIVPELERRGIPVVVVQPKNVEAVLESVRAVGKLVGKEGEALALSQTLQKRLAAVAATVATAKGKPRVYLELDPKLISVGPGSFLDDMIARAGGQNVASDATNQWPQLSQESLLIKDPEVILLADHAFGETPEKVAARPGWQVIGAVKKGRVHPLDADLTNRPSPRVFDGLEAMARLVQPELFR